VPLRDEDGERHHIDDDHARHLAMPVLDGEKITATFPRRGTWVVLFVDDNQASCQVVRDRAGDDVAAGERLNAASLRCVCQDVRGTAGMRNAGQRVNGRHRFRASRACPQRQNAA
jgi:hypothetical protein